MHTYKGIEVDASLAPLIGRMESVEEYREMLQNLQSVWDNLTLLGQLSGTGTDMSGTRQAFASLTAALLNNLGVETRRKMVLDMESKAQVAIDIMVRNLFERTADTGFLATAPARQHPVRTPHVARARHGQETTAEIATFYIGEEWFGIPSQNVVEAIDAVGITPLPGMPDYVRGVVMFGGDPLLVFCLRNHLHFKTAVDPAGYTQIVVVRAGDGEPFGILVHRLGEIPEVENEAIDSVANLFPGEGVLSESVVRPDPAAGREGILVVLSPERIRQKLVKARERAGATVREFTASLGAAAQG